MSAAAVERAPVLLRAMQHGDHRFVFNSWVRSYADSAWSKLCGASYRAGHDAIVERLVRESFGLVACYKDDTETILGWAVTGNYVVHYVYVRKDFRRRGIARMLLAPFLGDERVRYTHLLPSWAHAPSGWTFDPYPMMGDA